MKIFITGGTGLVGSNLIPQLLNKNHTITVLSRNIQKAQNKLGNDIKYCNSLNSLTSLDEYDAVINLAGEPIAGRLWTKAQKKRLCESRWSATQKISQLIKAGKNPPVVFISGSAIGYYGNKKDTLISEETDAHEEFTHFLCKSWEHFAQEAKSEKTRVYVLRTGIILSKQGGMLAKILPIFKLGLGGFMGSGKQYISWIHIEDMVNIIDFLLTNSLIDGPVNATAPNPITNKEFSKKLAKILNRPCFFKVPSIVLSLVMGESSTLLLDGQRAIPAKLELNEFQFRYKNIDNALTDILK